MNAEVTVANPAYWSDRAPQLAQLLRSANERGGPSTIGDPTGTPPDPEHLLSIADPAYWSGQPRELAEVLAIAAQHPGPATGRGLPGGAVGAGSGSQERLTLTVEEAAAALGISRAFAYEAVGRGEIPSIRIGRRVLVPKAALNRLVGAEPASPTD